MLCILQIENTLNQFGFLQLYEVKNFSTRLIARFRIYDVDITKIKNWIELKIFQKYQRISLVITQLPCFMGNR